MFAKVKQLFTNLVIYGLGDVATTIISFFLLPIYVRYLSPDDYGSYVLVLTTTEDPAPPEAAAMRVPG